MTSRSPRRLPRTAPKLMRLATAALSLGLLAACATPDQTVSTVDARKVGQVERTARDRGIQLIWVNYPTRRVEVAQNTPSSSIDNAQKPAVITQ